MSAPRVELVWERGGHAEVVRLEGDAIELRSTSPAPPGARLEATLASAPSSRVKVKSHGTKLEPDGTYRLKGRVLDATRELREVLAGLSRTTHEDSA